MNYPKQLLLLALFLISSLAFSQNTTKWSAALVGLHTAYYDSENTLSSDYTKSTQTYFCGNGEFVMVVGDNYSVSTFNGIWKIDDKNLDQATTLTLYFSDGDVLSYKVSYVGDQLYVDGDLVAFDYINPYCG